MTTSRTPLSRYPGTYLQDATHNRVAVTDTAATVSIPRHTGRQCRNLYLRNDGPDAVYVNFAGKAATTAVGGAFKLPADRDLPMGEYSRESLSMICATGETATVEILATY